jgi:NADP-dependent aldehyde dehydrogenase
MAVSPIDDQVLATIYPISTRQELSDMAVAATAAQPHMAHLALHEPARLGTFLRRIAVELQGAKGAIIQAAHRETALPAEPRLGTVEFGRMLLQLEQAAACCDAEQAAIAHALTGDAGFGERSSWRRPRRDAAAGIASMLEPLDRPVLSIGPNNFPLAYHGCVGGDTVAAFASGHAVIAKGHPLHPGTGVLLAECVHRAALAADMPAGCFQFIAHAEPADLASLIESSIGAVAFTGSRRAGLSIKATCDRVGVPAFLEMSSVNPVWMVTKDEASMDACADAWLQSVTLGAGQFCTKPGLLLVPDHAALHRIVSRLAPQFDAMDDATLLSIQGAAEFRSGIERLRAAGAALHSNPAVRSTGGARVRPTLCSASANTAVSANMLDEVFGPFGLVLSLDGVTPAMIYAAIGGQLTSGIWCGPDTPRDIMSAWLAQLRPHCGRLLTNKMPTGVTVTESMVHGGPFPATGAAAHTAVGFPISMLRFAARRCYDAVPAEMRPPLLR